MSLASAENYSSVVFFRPRVQSPRMKSFLKTILPALIFIAASFSASAQNDPAISPTNKMNLFDGKSFSGWAFVSKSTNAPAESIWSITNGVIRCLGKPNGYARTLQNYRDYKLHAEWRYPAGAGNSGVFVHVNPPDKVWPYCFEANTQAGVAGEVRMNGGSKADGLTEQYPKSVPRQQPSSEKPAGEWNSFDIICRSNTIDVRVNGVLQNQITGTSASSGAIALQAEGKLIEFTNIYIEPLSD
jgi:Domain of Unknown Function (DUF1080)